MSEGKIVEARAGNDAGGLGVASSEGSSGEDVGAGMDARQNSEESLGFSDSSEELCPLVPKRDDVGEGSGHGEPRDAGSQAGQGGRESCEGSNGQRKPSRRERKISVASKEDSSGKVSACTVYL